MPIRPHFLDENKEPVTLVAEPGKTVVYRHILHKGQVRVNVIGYLQKGYAEPSWVMSNLPAKVGGQIYFALTKFRKTLVNLQR